MLLITIVVAPVWYIFQFARDIFMQVEAIKLIIISLAISVPLLYLNTMIHMSLMGRYISKNESENEFNQRLLISPMFYLMMVLYIPCIVTYFDPLTLRNAILFSISMQCSALAMELTDTTFKKRDIKALQKKQLEPATKEP
jgi:hypothetical protein